VKRPGLICLGLFVGLWALSLKADTFRDVGALPPRATRSFAMSADPDLDLPTENTHPHPAVVRIIVPEKGSTSYGSGTLVDVNGEHGLVVTNWHVVSESASPPTVLFADGFRSLAQVVRADHDWDLAALVIWRPNAGPVRLATEAPRPGERLSIAGYGKGPYRLASGPCTNYLAPNTRLPREMVELKVIARQGDSGGPIFNGRGELAGVLWGEGNGYTTGSYCGRVRRFLSSVVPGSRPSDAEPTVTASPQIAASPPVAGALISIQSTASATLSANDRQAAGTMLANRPRTGPTTGDASAQHGAGSDTRAPASDWQTWLGRTRADQAKTLLAVVGAFALLIRMRRSVAPSAAA